METNPSSAQSALDAVRAALLWSATAAETIDCKTIVERGVEALPVIEAAIEAKCQKPDVAMCAKLWEADHQRNALLHIDAARGTKLAEEFVEGCDNIDAVAEELVDARAEVERLKGERDALAAVRAKANALAEAAERSGEGCITGEPFPVEGHCRNCTLQARVAAYRGAP